MYHSVYVGFKVFENDFFGKVNFKKIDNKV